MAQPQRSLESNAIGLLTTAALTAAYMAPAISIYTLFGPMVKQAGIAVGFVVFLGLLITLPSAVSFGMLTRVMPSAGGVYAWCTKALGPGAGVFAGITIAAYYLLTVFFPPIVFGQFFNGLLQTFGIQPRTWTLLAGAATALVLTGAVTYRGIIVSSRLAFTMLMTELAVVVALGLTFLALSFSRGLFSWAPVQPQAATGGWSGIFLALPMALLSMTCDAATPTSEETKDAKRIIPLTIVVTTLLVGAWYVVGFSSFALAAPRDQILAMAADENANIIVPLARTVWGSFSILVTLTGMTAAIGALVPCSTAASRVLFAMGRDGTLPGWLGDTHPRFRSPWNALHVVHATTVLAILLVMLAVGANQTITWWSNVFAWFIAVGYFFANLANIVYYWRFAGRFHFLLNLVVPLIGMAAQVLIVWRVVIVDMSDGSRFGRTGQIFIAAATLAILAYIPLALRSRATPSCSAPEHSSCLAESGEELQVRES